MSKHRKRFQFTFMYIAFIALILGSVGTTPTYVSANTLPGVNGDVVYADCPPVGFTFSDSSRLAQQANIQDYKQGDLVRVSPDGNVQRLAEMPVLLS